MSIRAHGKLIVFFSLFAGVMVAALFGVKILSSQTKELQQLREQRREMEVLRDEFLAIQKRIQAGEGRKSPANFQGVLQAVDEVFSSIGLKDKVKTVKTTGKRETKDGVEEEADVFVEKVTMNEMVNIFYRIEHAPMILTVKKASVKLSFDNPDLLNITLMLSFLKPR